MSSFFRVCVIIFMLQFLPNGNSQDNPLFLTPYISAGRIDEARELSRVHLPDDTSNIESYSGFITVNKTDNGNMFFWFFPVTECCKKTAPLLIWLQGGPGGSGLAGLFNINGPYVLYPNISIGLREHPWTNNFSLIYVDNPVGTGFSFTGSDDGYARNQKQVADNLYEFLQQFFRMFEDYRKNDFYVTGVSYGGKYVSSLSYKIHMERRKSGINFKGMAIGNGYCDPETMMDYAPYFYQHGLVDRKQAKLIKLQTDAAVECIRTENYWKFQGVLRKLLDIFQYVVIKNTDIGNYTGFNYFFNYLLSEEPKAEEYYVQFAAKPEVRKALHVANLPFHNRKKVADYLSDDIMRSVKPQATVIMEHYKCLFFSGQLDLAIPWPMTVNFLQSVVWKHAAEYKAADRIIWRLCDSDYIAGYVHQVDKFMEVMVRNAGHFAPREQPEACLDLMKHFIYDKPFENCKSR